MQHISLHKGTARQHAARHKFALLSPSSFSEFEVIDAFLRKGSGRLKFGGTLHPLSPTTQLAVMHVNIQHTVGPIKCTDHARMHCHNPRRTAAM